MAGSGLAWATYGEELKFDRWSISIPRRVLFPERTVA